MSQFALRNDPGAPPFFPQPPAQFPLAAKWPTAIGLVSLILGIAHFVVGGAIQTINLGFTLHRYGGSSSTSLRGFIVNTCASMTAYMISGVILLIAGILLLRRRPLARTFHYSYAIASLFMALAVMGIDFVLMFQGNGLGYIITGIALLLEPYPIFCLIWFSRADVRLDIHEMGEPPTET